MYSLWKEVSDQLKKKAEDLNNTIQEFNINGLSKDNKNESTNTTTNETIEDKIKGSTIFSSSLNEKLNLINKKLLNKDLSELQYYNDKFKSGISNIKKIVGDIYNENIKPLGEEEGNKKKIFLSKIVPWKKADIMISKIYRKKFDEGIPLKVPNSQLNKEVYEKILELNINKNKILHTEILENYNFSWSKKKEQSERIIEEDPNLLKTKNFLVPNYMSEIDFWKSYFFNIDIIYNEIADDIYESREYIAACYKQGDQGENNNTNGVVQTMNDNVQHGTIPLATSTSRNDTSLKNNFIDIKSTAPSVNNTSSFLDVYNMSEPKENVESTTLFKDTQKESPNPVHLETKEHLLTFDFDQNATSVNILDEVDFDKLKIKQVDEDKKEDFFLSNEKKNLFSTSDLHETKNGEIASAMQMAKINGLNIYMDNDIYINLTEGTGGLSEVLNNSKEQNHTGTILASEETTKRENLFYERNSKNMESFTFNENETAHGPFLKCNEDQMHLSEQHKDESYTDSHPLRDSDKSMVTHDTDQRKHNLIDYTPFTEELADSVTYTNEKREEAKIDIKNPCLTSSANVVNDDGIRIIQKEPEKKTYYKKEKEHEIIQQKENKTTYITDEMRDSFRCNDASLSDECNAYFNVANKENDTSKTDIAKVIESEKQNEFILQQKNLMNPELATVDVNSFNTCKMNKEDIDIFNFENNGVLKEKTKINENMDTYSNDVTTKNTWNEHKNEEEKGITEHTTDSFMEMDNFLLEKKEKTQIENFPKEIENSNDKDGINKKEKKKEEETDLFNFNDDINLDEINFGDNGDFNLDSNSFNEEELNQFENYILNT